MVPKDVQLRAWKRYENEVDFMARDCGWKACYGVWDTPLVKDSWLILRF